METPKVARISTAQETDVLDEKATAYKGISEAIERMGQAFREGRRDDFLKIREEVEGLFRNYGYAE